MQSQKNQISVIKSLHAEPVKPVHAEAHATDPKDMHEGEKEIEPGGARIVYGYVSPGKAGGAAAAEEFLKRDVNLIAITMNAKDEQHRRKSEARFTHLASETALAEAQENPDGPTGESMHAIRKGAEQGKTSSEFIEKLFGTNVEVALIAPPDNHPDSVHNAVPAEINQKLPVAVKALASTDELTQLVSQAAETGASFLEATERHMAARLEELSVRFPGAKIGVLVGGDHKTLEDQMGPNVPTEHFEFNRAGEHAACLPSNIMHAANEIRAEGSARAETLARAVLEETLTATHRAIETPHNIDALRIAIHARTDTEVSQLLTELQAAREQSSSYWNFRRRSAHLMQALEAPGPLDTQPKPPYRKLPPGSSRLYIFNEHSWVAGRSIARIIRENDTEVVALEGAVATEDGRIRRGENYTFLSSAEGQERIRQEPEGFYGRMATRIYKKRRGQIEGTMYGLRGSNVKLHFIDMPFDNPLRDYMKQNMELEAQLQKVPPQQEMTTAAVAELAVRAAEVKLYATETRDRYMADRLDELSHKYRGKKLTVVVGAFHTNMVDMVDPSADVKTTFVSNEGIEMEMPKLQRIQLLTNEMRFGDGPTPTRVAQVTLSICLARSIVPLDAFGGMRYTQDEVLDRIESLSYSEAQRWLGSIDRIKTSASTMHEYQRALGRVILGIMSK